MKAIANLTSIKDGFKETIDEQIIMIFINELKNKKL